jgi:carbonic anhydrase/acetyltransferase-like protein (isoleucine patch superfamily)
VESADVVGEVVLERDSSIWYNAVLRGDINKVRVGERTNIQDGCILHVTEQYPVEIGANVTVGHGAILHGCTVKDCCLIGMGAIVLDNAQVGPYSLVAAGALVREHSKVPEGMLVAGVPAKVVRPLTSEERRQLEQSAEGYVGYAQSHKAK